MQSGGEGSLERLLSGFGGALSGRLGSLNTEDLLLLAIVYLMYRENGDKQLLVVLAALLLCSLSGVSNRLSSGLPSSKVVASMR